MAAERWTGRAVEMVVAGCVSVAAGLALYLVPGAVSPANRVPAVSLFLLLGGVGFFIAWWDVAIAGR